MSKRGSSDSIVTKKPSVVTRRKRALRKTGWLKRGSRFRANMPTKAVTALERIVSSKATGMFAGRLHRGFPLTMSG